jgi:hypothetical protein
MEILKSDKHKPFFFFFVLRYATSMLGKCFEFANLKERDWAEIASWLCSSISKEPEM